MKIAVFGGAFNPVHIGHTALADAFDRELCFDKILIIPSGISPHKSSAGLIGAADRLAMCRLAFRGKDKAQISDIECRRAGKSYTADTLEELSRIYRGGELFLLCGSDMFLTLHSWRDPERIFDKAVICAARRADESDERIKEQKRRLESAGARVLLTEAVIPAVSSTAIRARLQTGEDCADELCPAVCEYIRAHGLYV